MRLLLVLACLAAPAAADVSATDAKKASKLFDEGRKQIAAGHVAEACETFAASLAIDPQIGTKLNLAACREQDGKLVEAYALFEQAAAEAARTKKPSREAFARDHLKTLAGKLVRVRVQVTNPRGTTVKLGDKVIDPTEPQLVLPGTIVVEVTAPDRVPFHVEKAAAGGAELAIDVPALAPIQAVAPPIVVTPRQPPGAPPIEPPRRRSIAPWVAGGLALVVASGGLALHAKLRYDDAVDHTDRDAVHSAQREADVATAVAIAGGVALGVAIVLRVRGGGSHDRVVVAPTLHGVGIAGRF